MKKMTAVLALVAVLVSGCFSVVFAAEVNSSFVGLMGGILGSSGSIEKVPGKTFQWIVGSGTFYHWSNSYEKYTLVAETKTGFKWANVSVPIKHSLSVGDKEYLLGWKDIGVDSLIFKIFQIDGYRVEELTLEGVPTSGNARLQEISGAVYAVVSYRPSVLVKGTVFFDSHGQEIGAVYGEWIRTDGPVVVFSDGHFQTSVNLETGNKWIRKVEE